MSDGYVLIEYNTEGKGRVSRQERLGGLHYFDYRLEQLDLGCDDGYSMLEGQLPKDFKDVQIMAFFTYQSVKVGGGDYWTQEYEDNFILDSFTVVKEDYKEFYHKMLSLELEEDIQGVENINQFTNDGDNYYIHLIEDYEEFYDEDFIPLKSDNNKTYIPFKD